MEVALHFWRPGLRLFSCRYLALLILSLERHHRSKQLQKLLIQLYFHVRLFHLLLSVAEEMRRVHTYSAGGGLIVSRRARTQH